MSVAERKRTGAGRRLVAVPVLGVLLAAGAVSCASDNSAQLDSWAKTVCDAMRDPVTQSQSALDDTGQVKDGEAPADLQKRLSADLGTLGTANQQIADAIDKAGAPKTTNGAGLQKDAVNELHQVAQGYQDVRKKLDALQTGDQAKFADGLKSIGDQVQQLAQLSTGALGKVQSGDLGKAIAKQAGCKSTGAGGASAAGGSPAASGSPAPSGASAQSGAPSGAPSADAAASPPASSLAPAAPSSAAPSSAPPASASPSATHS